MGINQIGAAVGISVSMVLGGLFADTNTTETGTNTAADAPITRESRGAKSSASNQSGIITGDWELEGESMFDLLFVTIERDPYGNNADYIEDIDPTMIAAEIGYPFIGEPQAPSDCRLFTYGGPMGIPMVVGFCADGDYTLYVVGTDIEVIRSVMYEFNAGDPFTVPYGYSRSY